MTQLPKNPRVYNPYICDCCDNNVAQPGEFICEDCAQKTSIQLGDLPDDFDIPEDMEFVSEGPLCYAS